MLSQTQCQPLLAPLQRIMLADSLAREGSGVHVEQVEIVFARGADTSHVISAWRDTVSNTAALHLGFVASGANPTGCERVTPDSGMTVEDQAPLSWEEWLETDRKRPLLGKSRAPWRASWWPRERRFVWTFHHALLDGRSIARIVERFLKRVAGMDGGSLDLAGWNPPSSRMLMDAWRMFDETFAGMESADIHFPLVTPDGSAASRSLGHHFGARLGQLAEKLDVTAPTLLTWAWGQALAETAGADAVLVDQVRAGIQREGTAGFTMNALPVLIHRAMPGNARENLRNFRRQLVELRGIETVSPADFPAGVFPANTGPWNSVIMVERGTLREMTGPIAGPSLIDSLVLHEPPGQTLAARAYVLPDMRLEVEGQGRHDLLGAWVGALVGLFPTTGHSPWT